MGEALESLHQWYTNGMQTVELIPPTKEVEEKIAEVNLQIRNLIVVNKIIMTHPEWDVISECNGNICYSLYTNEQYNPYCSGENLTIDDMEKILAKVTLTISAIVRVKDWLLANPTATPYGFQTLKLGSKMYSMILIGKGS